MYKSGNYIQSQFETFSFVFQNWQKFLFKTEMVQGGGERGERRWLMLPEYHILKNKLHLSNVSIYYGSNNHNWNNWRLFFFFFIKVWLLRFGIYFQVYTITITLVNLWFDPLNFFLIGFYIYTKNNFFLLGFQVFFKKNLIPVTCTLLNWFEWYEYINNKLNNSYS